MMKDSDLQSQTIVNRRLALLVMAFKTTNAMKRGRGACSILRAEIQSVVIYGAVGADVGTSAPSSSDTNLLLYTKDTV